MAAGFPYFWMVLNGRDRPFGRCCDSICQPLGARPLVSKFAKSGLAGFTRALAYDLAGDNVTANCVAPGLVSTARPKDFVEPQHHAIHHTLSGKRGAPEDIATLVRFLCGPGARYITGQTIHASGGAFLT